MLRQLARTKPILPTTRVRYHDEARNSTEKATIFTLYLQHGIKSYNLVCMQQQGYFLHSLDLSIIILMIRNLLFKTKYTLVCLWQCFPFLSRCIPSSFFHFWCLFARCFLTFLSLEVFCQAAKERRSAGM